MVGHSLNYTVYSFLKFLQCQSVCKIQENCKCKVEPLASQSLPPVSLDDVCRPGRDAGGPDAGALSHTTL